MAEKKIQNFRNPGKTRHTEANVDSTLELEEGQPSPLASLL